MQEQVGSRVPLPAEDALPQISADFPVPRDARRYVRPARCPMLPGEPAYHDASVTKTSFPSKTGNKRPPGPSAKITQGARPLRQEPLPCNLTR